MKKEVKSTLRKSPRAAKGGKRQSKAEKKPRIHPIIMYPYFHPRDASGVRVLYEELISSLHANPEKYATPITVVNRQTYYSNTEWTSNPSPDATFQELRENCVSRYSRIIDAWCVDTCQMWLTGFGEAYDEEQNTTDDVYWLIPGDFDYALKPNGLQQMRQLPEPVLNYGQDLCLGEIDVDINSSKQLIDTHATNELLRNWFPREAQDIQSKTSKPRTEFFAISHSFLHEVLRQRWYAYEQTIIILLQAVSADKRIHTIRLGSISDPSQGRDTLSAAMQQVERTERALKQFWLERNQHQADWSDRFRKLDSQSGQIRAKALEILENLLVYP